MNLIRDLTQFPASLRGGAVSIGNFDGVHRGHARLVARLVDMARRLGGPALVFTFDPHPLSILRPAAAPTPLCSAARKAELLAELGVDAVIAYPTDAAFLQLDAPQFFQQIVCDRLAARGVVEGPDFRFGRGRQGDAAMLRQLCGAAGVELEILAAVEIDGQMISSSRIREAISTGRIDAACQMLTEPYRIRGTVIHGAGRGRHLGFPTANVDQIDTLLPVEGIYAGRAIVDGGGRWPAAISLGPNPTFGENARKVEVYLIGFDGDLYDQPLEVDFLARLRDIERFGNVAELVASMNRDVATARDIARQFGT